MSVTEIDYESLEESESGKGSSCSDESNNKFTIDLSRHDTVPTAQVSNLADCKNVHIGPEYSYMAPVHIHADVLQMTGNLKDSKLFVIQYNFNTVVISFFIISEKNCKN